MAGEHRKLAYCSALIPAQYYAMFDILLRDLKHMLGVAIRKEYVFTNCELWNVSLSLPDEAPVLFFKESIVITLKLKSVQNQLKFYWFLTSM